MIKKIVRLGCFLIGFLASSLAHAQIQIVSAENTYAQLAERLGGKQVTVQSLMPSTKADPHLFSVGVQQAKRLNEADIVVYNGAAYDVWMEQLLASQNQKGKGIIRVSDLVPELAKQNPHLWYHPDAISAYLEKLYRVLVEIDPNHKEEYARRYNSLKQDQARWLANLNDFRHRYRGERILMTEPVSALLTDYLGLKTDVPEFGLKIMNEATPSAQEIVAFQKAIKDKKVKLLIVNQQMRSSQIDQMVKLAKQYHLPIVYVSETQRPDQDYYVWMRGQLGALLEAIHERD